MLRARQRLILVITVVAGVAAFAYSIVKEPTYEATATLQFEDPTKQGGQVLGQVTSDFFPQGEAATGTEILTGGEVVTAVNRELGGGRTPDELRASVTAAVDAQSNLVNVTASADTGAQAARIANEFARQAKAVTRAKAREFFREAARRLGDSPVNFAVVSRLKTLAAVAEPVEIVRPAEVPGSPASPKPIRDTIIALFLGLLLGIGVAFLRHSLDRRITDGHEIQKELGIPLVGQVRAETLGMTGLSMNGASAVSEDDLEAFRILRTNVDFLAGEEGLRTVAVTSPLPEEGKSTVAGWFAYANAVAGRRTILIECDFRRPVFAERFGFDGTPGLGDYLAGDAAPADVLRAVTVEGPSAEPLPVIPAGINTFQPAEVIASRRFGDFLSQIARAYELVVLDCAPLLPVGDTLELLPQVDGALLCVRLGQTTRDQASAAREAMHHLPGRPTGLVVTGLVRGSEDDYYGYYSSYVSSEA